MDFAKAFTYVFDDEEWVKKVLIGGVLSLIPIVNLVTVGYWLKVLKNVAEGAAKPLPEWDDFGDYFVKGLMSMLASLIWAIPIILMGAATAAISALTGYDSAGTTNAAGPFVMCLWGMSCLSGIWGLFLGLVLPAAHAVYAVKGDFAAFFRLDEIKNYITANLGNYIIALLLFFAAQIIASFGVVLCFVGVAFTEFWSMLVGGHLLGQLHPASANSGPAGPADTAL